MTRMNVLVFDVGTSSMRGTLYRENGEHISNMQIQYQVSHGNTGIVEQNPETWEHALYCIAEAIAKTAKDAKEKIDIITITAQRSSVIPINRNGEPLSTAIMWQDKRNVSECIRLKSFDELIFAISGSYVNPVFSGSKMSWVRHNEPEVYQKTYKFLNVPEYLLYKMTGEFRTDYTYGSRSNLMDLRKRAWSKELLDLFEVNEKHLCELQEPGSVIGETTAAFSKRTGISVGVPVISAGGDQQCGAIGQGVFEEGHVSIVTGSGAFIVAASAQVPEQLQGDVICNCASVSGSYILEANVLTCSSAFDWFCKNFYEGEKIEYDKVNDDLESVYGINNPCVVLPYFQGRSTPKWNADATAMIANVTLATKRQDILKAVVEGIFMEVNNNIQALRKYVDINYAFISGGLTKSKVMNHMQADIYGIPLYHMEDSESTALGALMVTLVSRGIYQTYREAFNNICRRKEKVRYIYNELVYKQYVNKQQYMNELYKKVFEL
ncbi:MAG: FGGY-family carbohydrate kinase [Lachnospiraceae bacterium]